GSLSTQSPFETQHPATAVWVQPVRELHASVVQRLESSQLGGWPATHCPAWQVESPAQKSSAPQASPFGTGVQRHPVAGSQSSLVHALPSLQGRGSLEHAWFRQRSLIVQALLSAQSASVAQQPGIC